MILMTRECVYRYSTPEVVCWQPYLALEVVRVDALMLFLVLEDGAARSVMARN